MYTTCVMPPFPLTNQINISINFGMRHPLSIICSQSERSMILALCTYLHQNVVKSLTVKQAKYLLKPNAAMPLTSTALYQPQLNLFSLYKSFLLSYGYSSITHQDSGRQTQVMALTYWSYQAQQVFIISCTHCDMYSMLTKSCT